MFLEIQPRLAAYPVRCVGFFCGFVWHVRTHRIDAARS